ncbi:MAG: endolytic transglycosylase MltG, partial [Dehalococcoidia bacterium]
VVGILAATVLMAQTPDSVFDGSLLGERQQANSRETVDYALPEGASASDVGGDLESRGIIRSGRQFQVLLALMGLQDQLSAGDHRLKTNSSVVEVIDLITVKAGVDTLRVTFPEGLRIEEMAVRAQEAGFGLPEEFLAAVERASLPASLEGAIPEGQGLQGYLFPDTYILPVGATMDDLVGLMLETFDERFSPELRAAAEAKGLTIHQAVTLASIIEREAVIPEERPLMAGVFFNRLAAGDALGADPTVQFALTFDAASVEEFGYWKRELTLEDLEVESPYNTRKVPGMPPGPITNPGLASLEAVANAEETEFYYFVADARKADGSHVFAVTLDEHLANQALYGSP